MATTTTDLIAASRALDPASRALLNLWLHRGLDDEAIARLSGGSAADVADRRRRLVERLAHEVGETPESVRSALDALAAGDPEPTPQPEPATSDVLVLPGDPEPADLHEPAEIVLPGEPEPEAIHEPAEIVLPGEPEPEAIHEPAEIVLPGEPEPEPQRRPAPDLYVPPVAAARPGPAREQPRPGPRSRPRATARRSPIPATLGLAVGIVLVVMIIAAQLTAGGGESEQPARTPQPTPTVTAPAGDPTSTPAAEPPGRPLTALPGGPEGVEGTVSVGSDRLRVEVRGLERPARDYDVWLFNSVADARRLGSLDASPFPLPARRGRYAFVDVSLEPGANPNHSGRSVLRTALPR